MTSVICSLTQRMQRDNVDLWLISEQRSGEIEIILRNPAIAAIR